MTDHEREVIRLRFGMNGGYARTLEEVSRILNVSVERVRQLEENALRKLRNAEYKEFVQDFTMCALTY